MVNHTATWLKPRGRLSAAEIADGYFELLAGVAGAGDAPRPSS
jgi:hypothetical protein